VDLSVGCFTLSLKCVDEELLETLKPFLSVSILCAVCLMLCLTHFS
jgi:hypothetical protein